MTQQTTSLGAPVWARISSGLIRRLPVAKYRAMNWVCKGRSDTFLEALPASHLRLVFECNLRNALAREVYFTGQYEPQETALVRELLGAGDVFVDVGAHWGYFSLLAAEIVGNTGRVVSVEADPRIFRILARNAALNALPQLQTVHVAAGESDGTLSFDGFSEDSDNWGVSRMVGEVTSVGNNPFSVASRPLDAILDGLGVDKVDLMKMDIEGAECYAFAGMKAGLESGRYRRILLELHPVQLAEHGQTADALVRRLLDLGYRGWQLSHDPDISRRAAYKKTIAPRQLLTALSANQDLESWPHVLLVSADTPEPAFATR